MGKINWKNLTKINSKNTIKPHTYNLMDINKYNELKNKYDDLNWASQWKPIKNILYLLSYFGHIVLIAFGYSFIYGLLFDAVQDELPAFMLISISVVLLTLFELLKRSLFYQTTFEILKSKGKLRKEIAILFIFCISIIVISFYVALNGASKFSDRSTKIEFTIKNDFSKMQDSIKKKYEPDILRLRTENDKLLKINEDLMKQVENEQYAWYKQQYIQQTNNNSKRIESINIQIKDIQERQNLEIEGIKKEFNSEKKDKNVKNADVGYKFILTSIFMELIILIGIFFHNYYEKKTLEEYNTIYYKDPKYKRWNKYAYYLNIIYKDGKYTTNDICISNRDLISIIRMQDKEISDEDIIDFNKICIHEEIIKTTIPGELKKINVDYFEAQNIIKKYLKI